MAMRPIEEKRVTLKNGLNVHYYEWPGSGPTLILLHPSSGYARMWEWTVDNFGDRFHVIAPDQRGHGDTDKPDGEYSAEEYAVDLEQFMAALNIEKAVIGGQSLGGRVTQAFAATHPEATQAVVLVSGPHASNFFPTHEAVTNVLTGAYNSLTSTTEWPNRDAALEALRKMRTRDDEKVVLHRLEYNTNTAPDGSVSMKYDKVRVALGLAHMADDMRKYAARTTCPVLLLTASRSTDMTPERTKQIVGCWKNATIKQIEGMYSLHMENPAGVAQAARDFIDWAVR